ncbi:MAG: hypothetical protein H8E73_03220 [Planctomycetes bacterium]|nr:hypothetical protein [Planctomycetota bacterium]
MTDHKRREAGRVVVLLVCAVAILGCNGGNAKQTESDKSRILSVAGGRAGLLTKLERRFANPDVHFELGQSYRNDGLWTQAEYHFETAVRFDPLNRDAQAAMVKLLIDTGEQARASVCAKRYLKQADYSWKETLKLGKALEQEGAEEYALACYQQAVRLSPESPEGHKALGCYYLSKNNNDMAKECLKQSFRLDPSQAEVAGELGRLGVIVRLPRSTETDSPG